MEFQVLIGVAALVLVAIVVALTALWQRDARRERRTAYLESEIGISEAEREQAEAGRAPGVPHDRTVRARLDGMERKDSTLGRRIDRLASRR